MPLPGLLIFFTERRCGWQFAAPTQEMSGPHGDAPMLARRLVGRPQNHDPRPHRYVPLDLIVVAVYSFMARCHCDVVPLQWTDRIVLAPSLSGNEHGGFRVGLSGQPIDHPIGWQFRRGPAAPQAPQPSTGLLGVATDQRRKSLPSHTQADRPVRPLAT